MLHPRIDKEAVKFKQIVVDCFSVGYITSELHPRGALESFRIRNVVLCLLTIVKVYLLCVFDFEVFKRYLPEVQDRLVTLFLKVFQEFNGPDLHTMNLKDKCKEVQAALLQQNIFISPTIGRDLQVMWQTATLPKVILYCNIKEADVIKFREFITTEAGILLETLPTQILLEPKDEQCYCLRCYAYRINALVLSNSETSPSILHIANHDSIIQPTVCLNFSITKDSAYFYVPKDFKGRNEDTLMQHLILDNELKLSAYYEKAWSIKKDDVYFLDQSRKIVRKRRLNNQSKGTQAKLDLDAHRVYEYLLLANFETTWDGKSDKSCIEIVKFASILLDLRSETPKEVKHFSSFCQPQKNKLSAQFEKRTGIRQVDLAKAPQFLSMIKDFLTQMDIHDDSKVLFAVDSRDNAELLLKQCEQFSVPQNDWPKNRVNLQDAFKAHYELNRTGQDTTGQDRAGQDRTRQDWNRILKLDYMLYMQGLTFEGMKSCCLNRVRNLARVALQLMADGAFCKQASKPTLEKFLSAPYDSLQP